MSVGGIETHTRKRQLLLLKFRLNNVTLFCLSFKIDFLLATNLLL